LFFTFGSLTFSDVFARAALTHDKTTELTIITILLLIGATGKSAQIPLFTWLPDAMAGPTPVSALIHAATMVTAGIYMIARSGILFSLAPFTQNIIIVIGTATAVMAALTALKQNDIKKVLAYSTVSQLGYMFIALGLGAYNTAIFHVTTHAFFKALLFLGAGSVIHALHGEQDIRKMGGLKKSLPITYFTFIAGTLAISGIPPFAGFFSKDQILTAAFAQNIVLYLIALFTALVTCFYMFRLFFLVFHGQNRNSQMHPHESPFIMSIPLIILALLSVTGGLLNIPQFMGGREFFSTFLGTALPEQATNQSPHATEWLLLLVPVFLLVAVIYFAYQQFVVKKQSTAHVENNPGFVTKLLENKFYFDNLYQQIVEIPFEKLSVFLYRKVEVSTLDPLVDTIGTSMSKTGSLLRKLQQGNMSFYLFAMVAGILLFILFIFIV
jgi:NADH-quinone oxidoreductase subunit L